MLEQENGIEERVKRLEKDVEKLDKLRVLFLTASSLAVLFGISAGAIAYKTWDLWKFAWNGEMKVNIYTEQNGGKLVTVLPRSQDQSNDRLLKAYGDPKDGAEAANIFILRDPNRPPL